MSTQTDPIAEIRAQLASQQRQISAMRKILEDNGLARDVGVPKGDCHLGHDPKTCTSASTYRYQKGCHGAACEEVNRSYYAARRGTVVETPVAVKTAAKKKAAPAAPVKKKIIKKRS